MSLFDEHRYLLDRVYEEGNPVIKYGIERMFNDCDVSSSDALMASGLVADWLNAYDGNYTHGSGDRSFENSIAKLLDFGLDCHVAEFDAIYSKYVNEEHWQADESFPSQLMLTVRYPFLVRAGYHNEPYVKDFFMQRLNVIERTISRHGYDFELADSLKSNKYKDKFVFNIDVREEWLPTIYDLYAYAFHPAMSEALSERISKIVSYILTYEFQRIPGNAYIYDRYKKQYFAAGSVYHACLDEGRELLMLYILSNFKAAHSNTLFVEKLRSFLGMKNEDGYFSFDKNQLREKKNTYYIYNGSHMGMGENRRSKRWQWIESTYWMLRILKNMDQAYVPPETV